MSERAPLVLLRSGLTALPERLPRLQRETLDQPPEERQVVASWVFTMLALCLITLLLNLTVVGRLQHYVDQRHLYDQFRESLAAGSVPTGQTDVTGGLTPLGTPLAQLRIPSIGVDEIVVEGTSSWQTMEGVGHRRDTPLPGQPGVAVLMGRRAAYGGVFAHLDDLRPGDQIDVLTQQGTARYRVDGVRTDGTRLPVLSGNQGRLTLATASGGAFQPRGVTLVDAELVSTPFGKPAAQIGAAAIAPSEQVLAGDRSHAFALTWLLELLVLLLVAAVWSWKRWRRSATWLVFGPVLTVLGLAIANGVCGMLPNLM